jgi:type IV fimbrial biogenesis protein FimT
MRPLTHGLTLIELMVALAISAFLLTAASPYLGDYATNSRLREAGHALLSDALFAQSEALKRNGQVTLSVTAEASTVTDTRGPEPKVLRTRAMAAAYVAEPATVDFGSNGMPSPFGTATEIDLGLGQPGATCSAALRCPGLRIDGGGAIHLCANKLSCP